MLADRAGWTLEDFIDHTCSLAIGYGASGRQDVLDEYKAAKEAAIKLARQARVRMPWSSPDDELEASGGDEKIANLLKEWQADRSEYFTNPTLEIVAEYAAWRERKLLSENEWFLRQYPDAVASGDWEHIARLLSGRLRQMDKRARAANARADALEANQ